MDPLNFFGGLFWSKKWYIFRPKLEGFWGQRLHVTGRVRPLLPPTAGPLRGLAGPGGWLSAILLAGGKNDSIWSELSHFLINLAGSWPV